MRLALHHEFWFSPPRFLIDDAPAMRLGFLILRARAALAVVAACALATVLALPHPAAAEDGDESARAASARELFAEGVEAADQNRWAQAADRFRRARELRDSPVIEYNLASALEHLNALIEASELLRSIAENPTADRELRASAEATLAEIEPRIARVIVHARGRVPGDRITLDDKPLEDAQIDVAVPVDPGVHVASATRADVPLDRQTLELTEGLALEVTLDIPPAPAPAPAPAPRDVALQAAPAVSPVDVAQHETETQANLTSRWWFWAGAGAVVATALFATVILTSSSSSTAVATGGDIGPGQLHVRVHP
jgi:hypothetical protein